MFLEDANRVTYDRTEIEIYYNRLCLPISERVYDVQVLSSDRAINYLDLLMKQHLTNIPFENLDLHYSQSKTIPLHPVILFRKIVQSTGRGGYCMENNTIFACLLRSLGYDLYLTGARIFGATGFNGWTHAVILVRILNQQYLVDVGYGPNCATSPILLINDKIRPNVIPAAVRLLDAQVEGSNDMCPKLWHYQHRKDDKCDFINQYCFSTIEFFQRDFEVINHFTSTSPRSIFNQKLICVKMIPSGDSDNNIKGCIILQHDLKTRIYGNTVILESFKTEEQRLEALRREFQIYFTKEEETGIQGFPTALGQTAFAL